MSDVDFRCWPAALHCSLAESNFFRRTCNYFRKIIVNYVLYCRKLLIPRVHSLPRQGPWCFSTGPEQTWTNYCASGTSPLICVPICYVELSLWGCFFGLLSLLLLLMWFSAAYFRIPQQLISSLISCTKWPMARVMTFGPCSLFTLFSLIVWYFFHVRTLLTRGHITSYGNFACMWHPFISENIETAWICY